MSTETDVKTENLNGFREIYTHYIDNILKKKLFIKLTPTHRFLQQNAQTTERTTSKAKSML